MRKTKGVVSNRTKARYSDHVVRTVVSGFINLPNYLNKGQYLSEFGLDAPTMRAWIKLVQDGKLL